MSKPTKSKRVLVVGAGVAGSVVSYWLKKFGFSPTLIERSKSLRQNGVGLDIRGSALDVVKKMGIYKYLCQQKTQVSRELWVNAQGKVLVEKPSGYNTGDDIEVMRSNLMDILMDSVRTIPCYFDKNIIAIHQSEQSVSVTFQDHTVASYDILIGADGIH